MNDIKEIFKMTRYSVREFPGHDDLVLIVWYYDNFDGTNSQNLTLLCEKEYLIEELPRILEALQ